MELSTNLVILVLSASVTIATGSLDDLTKRTTHGDVRGQVTTVLDKQVAVYWGIPYAKIPARFQRPERADRWEGVFEATTPPPSCPEVPYIMEIPVLPPVSTAFHENCLFLNLWVPMDCRDKAEKDGLAVMVWIHSGAFQFGSTTVSTYNGQVLASTQCVIVASMNYRLGVSGFLSLGTASAPGNMGLLDQVMALQWIHDNAGSFGGSPDRITLFGESAGGLSVGIHMVSPLSQGLFSRAIIQSGPTTAPFGKTTVSQNAASARTLAEIMGCPTDSDDDMIRCLSDADIEEMGRVVSDLTRFQFPAFGIVVDGHLLHHPLSEPFISRSSKKVDVMIGTTRDDGSFPLYVMLETGGTILNKTSQPVVDQTTFHKIMKNVGLPLLHDTSTHGKLLVNLLEYIYLNFYLPDKRENYLSALKKMLGDLNFFCPLYTTVASLLNTNDVYMYLFEHHSSASPFPEWMGVVHASEIDFVFGRPLDQSHLFTTEERHLSRLMMNSWATFAKFGNPNSDDFPTQWSPLNNISYPYVVFSSSSDIREEHGHRYKECVFWNEVYTVLVSELTASSEKQKHDEL